MFDVIKKMIMFGAGLALLTTEKIEEGVNEMIKMGQISEKEGKELIAFLSERSRKIREDIGERTKKIVEDTMQRLNIPSRKEMDELRKRVDELEKALGKEDAKRDTRLE